MFACEAAVLAAVAARHSLMLADPAQGSSTGVSAAMTVAGRSTDLATLVAKAGVSDYCARYLAERGLKSVGATALISADAATFTQTIIDPLSVGWQGTELFKLKPEEWPIGKATLLCLRELCVEQRQQETAAAAAACVPAAPAASTTPAAAPAKPPSDLAPGEWKKLIQRYNNQKIDGRDRVFPESLLLGAEAVVGKAQFEHVTSKLWSPMEP